MDNNLTDAGISDTLDQCVKPARHWEGMTWERIARLCRELQAARRRIAELESKISEPE